MKKLLLTAAVCFLFAQKTEACAWYDPDYEYFNLFTQSIIKNKSYLPFLHTYSERFYGHEHSDIPDENIENWQKFFGNKLNYQETKYLLEKLPMADLNAFKKGNSTNPILAKLGSFQNNAEAIDYLIEAKYLEPYMRINYVEGTDSFYYRGTENNNNATKLDYQKTISALTSLYNTAKNPEIKLRYGYQIVRFNHYTRNYEKAIETFKTYVEPLKTKSAAYFLALDQFAGAQRGLKMGTEANWNFFQVFINSKSRKESAFVSMKLSDSASFQNIMKRAQTNEEKNMANFLLGYDEYTDPIPVMEKIYENDPKSDLLKVLAARSINELERSYLPNYYENDSANNEKTTVAKTEKTTQATEEKSGFWNKIVHFFKNLFNSEKKEDQASGNSKNEDELLNDPNRIPIYTQNTNLLADKDSKDFLDDFEKFTTKTKEKSEDEFWQIADAYLKFLKRNYAESSEILNKIKTTSPEYTAQINQMKMLNDITSHPKIDADFEEHLMKDYPKLFAEAPIQDSTNSDYSNNGTPSTKEFITDVLANRYFLQGEDGKSFLMSNKLSELQYNPNSKLVKSVEDFYKKPNKSTFEKQIIAKNIDDVGNIDAFFNVIYGDREMRLANFEKAKSFYEKAKEFRGIPRGDWQEINGKYQITPFKYGNQTYDGFKNISELIFGHNTWESYQSTENESMKSENFKFDFIKDKMNKLELAEALIQLKNIGNGRDEKAAEANQLIGNLLYNTSVLGYFREVFVMDVNNTNGGKYDFFNANVEQYRYYYKNFGQNNSITPDNFDLAINYYTKSLNLAQNREQKARILFQMASAEQGKYYQWETAQNFTKKDGEEYYDAEAREIAFSVSLDKTKNQKYRTYFADLKKNYGDTQTSKSLLGSCSYYDYFLKTH